MDLMQISEVKVVDEAEDEETIVQMFLSCYGFLKMVVTFEGMARGDFSLRIDIFRLF